MSRKPRTPRNGEEDKPADEPTGTTIAPSDELEAALAEAVASVEERQATAAAEEGAEAEESGASSEEAAALKDQLLRLHADFDNLRRRTLREKDEAFRYGHENLVKDLLPTVDNLERAVDHARQNEGGDIEGLLQGVELVLRELQEVFSRHGVEEIEAEGKTFDPAFHEAMAQAPDDSVPANTVVQVFQRGYQLRDHLIRPARVVVSKPSEEGGAKSEEPAAE
ncbi:MAG: nucleotide exchange factor GrpE [Deltaproteobacteria bacterium]|nr:nucleotide exchange factor GrpE [Deltaproteobacteria bacterium]MBW2447361.1 nucleotide exchange factor GrpE [Deltaproteobacteria bacterium]